MAIRNLLPDPALTRRPAAAIFLSGTGSNAENLLNGGDLNWIPAVMVTDAPESSRAAAIAEKFHLPLIEFSIREFYRSHGETRVSVKTEQGLRVRKKWTDELRRRLCQFHIDFGILAGFVPLSDITSDFPCLNVHPGDLTVEENGRRLLVGLHTLPVETAILRGFPALRSSVILAQPFTGLAVEMDAGPILGISRPVPLDLRGHSFDELRMVAAARGESRLPWRDVLSETAAYNQNRLKEHGDWVVFPRAVADFAAGRFGIDDAGGLVYRCDDEWRVVRTVEYSDNGAALIT